MKTPIFTMRMRPKPRALLDLAKAEERRSRASIIEDLILERYSERYADVGERLEAMLRGQQARA